MHLEYNPGDMMMVDFAGKKQHYTDPDSGEVIPCEVFIAVLPFSGLIFCKAFRSQQTADFASCINDMLRFYGGVPATILCDNLKTAVTAPSRYEPVFTEVCELLSAHYSTTFSATRPYSPRDKAMVEKSVSIVYNHIYGPLRNFVYASLADLNKAIEEQLQLLNDKTYKKTPYSRRYYFTKQEAPLLRELPSAPFMLRHTVQLTVQRNYHVQLSEDRRYYSVPYQYVGQKVKVYYDSRTVEVYLNGERIALHIRTAHQQAYTTLKEHMPPHHHRMQQIRGFNKDDLLCMAERSGPETRKAAELMLQNSIYIEQNYKACYGMLLLAKKYSDQRLEAACKRVLQGTRVNYTLIKNILERNLDKAIPEQIPLLIPDHENIRGKEAYQ
jgi:transposase